MLTKTVVIGMIVLMGAPAWAENSDANDPYKAITEVVQITPADPKSDDCVVKGTADFAKFTDRLAIFRDSFLNRDFSLDFYNQRRKQVLTYVVLKRAAELMTESMYRHSQPECRFSLAVSYPDKFGQERNFEAVTWRFNNEQAAKVNWEKFDPRDFLDVALDYDIKPAVMKWISDEPEMGNDKPAPAAAPADGCEMLLFNANAVFIRATTFCKKDYMDSDAGLAALAGAKKCKMPDDEMRAKAGSAMLTLDKIARQRGRAAVCSFVETMEREVLAKTRR